MQLDLLTSSAGASPASPGASPGSSEGPTTTGISGRKCADLLPLLGLDGCLARTLRGLLATRWDSTEFSLTWKTSATPARRCVFRLVPSTRRTSGIGCGSWPTPNSVDHKGPNPLDRRTAADDDLPTRAVRAAWPTMRAGDGACRTVKFPPRDPKGRLEDAVASAVWPTPESSDGTGGRVSSEVGGKRPSGAKRAVTLGTVTAWATPQAHERTFTPRKVHHGAQLANEAAGATPNGSGASSTSGGGALSPAFVCWLMGYPAGWLD